MERESNFDTDSHSTAMESDDICRECLKIDFEAIFNLPTGGSYMSLLHEFEFSLAHIHPQSNCPLCRFFYSIREPPERIDNVNNTHVLKLFPAKVLFGSSGYNWKDTPAFGVIPVDNIEPGLYYYPNALNPGIAMEEHYEKAEYISSRFIKSKIDVALVKEWIELCDDGPRDLWHYNLQLPDGFRVIDCTTRRIVAWDHIAGDKEFVTLSYVWGANSQETPLSDDALPAILPLTIEDAILLTANLGYRYLWVDRYCIRHGNDMDRQQQIQGMGRIYNQSKLTIIAAAGENPDHGLPGVHTIMRQPQPSVRIGDRMLTYARYAKPEVQASKWNSRGWTYQEALLARRKLVITDTQVYFQSFGMCCTESIQMPLKPSSPDYHPPGLSFGDKVQVFPLYGIGDTAFDIDFRLKEYLKRSLSNDMDTLDAFKGILDAYQQRFSGSFSSLCGIPFNPQNRYALEFALGWHPRPIYDYEAEEEFIRAHPPHLNRQSTEIPERRPNFPSWTWPGWKGFLQVNLASPVLNSSLNSGLVKSIVSIAMEYHGGEVLAWKTNSNDIVARERSGTLPEFLRLRGLTLAVIISSEGVVIGNDEANVLNSMREHLEEFSGAYMKSLARHMHSAFLSEQPDNGLLKCTLMILHYTDEEMHIMILYQPKSCSYMERTGFVSFPKGGQGMSNSKAESEPFPDILAGWTRRTIRLG